MTFRKYEMSTASGFTWLGDIPSTWSVRPLRRFSCLVQTGPFGSQLHAEEYVTGATPVVNPVHMVDGRIKPSEDVTVSEVVLDRLPHQRLQVGDVVFSRRGELGRCALVTRTEAGWLCGTGSMILRLNESEYDPAYLSRYLSLDIIRQYFESFSIGAVMDSLSSATLLAMPMVVPPLDEQKAISSFLDVETSKIDGLVSEQRRLTRLLAEKRQAVISHAVTKGLNPGVPMKPSGIQWLGDVPQHWNVSRIKFMVQPNDGIQMGPFGGMLLDLDGEDTGYKVFGQENTISGDFTRGRRWVSEERYVELERYAAEDGDLVLTRKGSLGNARLIEDLPQPGIIDSDTIRIRVDDDIVASRYLAKLLHEVPYIAEQITRQKRGAILPGLNTGIIANLVVVLPSRDEQNELLSYLDAESLRFDTLLAEAERAIELLQERRTALISAAVTGKIDVRGMVNKEVLT